MNLKYLNEKMIDYIYSRNPVLGQLLKNYPDFRFIPIAHHDFVKSALKSLGFKSKHYKFYFRIPTPPGSRGYFSELKREYAGAFSIYFNYPNLGWAFKDYYYDDRCVEYHFDYCWFTPEGELYKHL